MGQLDIITWGILCVLYGVSIAACSMVLGRARKRWGFAISDFQKKENGLQIELDRLNAIDAEVARREKMSVVLYDFTKKMSGCLKFDEIAAVLESFLREDLKDSLTFKKGELIVLKGPKGAYGVDRAYSFLSSSSVAARPAMSRNSSYNSKDILAISSANRKGKLSRPGGFAVMPIMNGEEIAAVLVMEDVREDAFEKLGIMIPQLTLEMKKVLLYETVEHLSIVDGLTGLYSRRYFLERLEEEMKRAKSRRLVFSFLMADIDHFKTCNDTYGHLVGDVCLRQMGRLIKESVREIDLVARYGGEEFSVILPDTGKERALAVAERIRKRIEENVFRAYDEKPKLTISIGAASYPSDGGDSNTLIDSADKAVYKAKADGRNLVKGYRDMEAT